MSKVYVVKRAVMLEILHLQMFKLLNAIGPPFAIHSCTREPVRSSDSRSKGSASISSGPIQKGHVAIDFVYSNSSSPARTRAVADMGLRARLPRNRPGFDDVAAFRQRMENSEAALKTTRRADGDCAQAKVLEWNDEEPSVWKAGEHSVHSVS
jgi:hypothetical protein